MRWNIHSTHEKLNFVLCLSHWYNAHRATVSTTLLELYGSVNQCIQGIILADTYILTRIMTSTALTYNHITSDALLTTEYLYTESLCCRLTTVLRTADTFFMCHFLFLLCLMVKR